MLITREAKAPKYALLQNTQLTLEEALAPPWTATFHRGTGTSTKGVFYLDRGDSSYHAERNIYFPTVYHQINVVGRTRFQIRTANHSRVGYYVNAIDYSPDTTFERVITACRCLVLIVACEHERHLRRDVGK